MLGDFIKNEQAGFGGLCGIVVDHDRGTVWINVSDRGFYRSDDHAKSFKRISDKQPKGRSESPGCFTLDPTGMSQRMLTALVYGSPVSASDNQGATWKSFNSKSSHVDWCAIDWSDPEMKFVLALKHESGGLLLASHDGGKTFAEIGKGFGPGWVFDRQTAVAVRVKSRSHSTADLVRTTDGGKTWKLCAEFSPVGVGSAQALPKWHGGKLYWLVKDSLIDSDDQGASWRTLADIKRGRYGPVFGKDRQMFVLVDSGVIESLDGGKSWSKPIAPPKGLKGVGGLTWLECDPKNDLLYIMKMGSDLYRLARKNKFRNQ